MNEKQAQQKGYRFTGDYERDKESLKERANEYKKQGYKVVICAVPDSPLSRGVVGVGYSIYAEEKYFIDKEVKELETRLNEIDDRKQLALNEYNNKISLIDKNKERMEERLKSLLDKCF